MAEPSRTLADARARYRVDVSGPTVVTGPEGPVALRPKERAVVAALAFTHPASIGWERLARLLWGLELPATARKTVHNHIARVRRVAPGLIETRADRYHLGRGASVDLDELDGSWLTADRHRLGLPERLVEVLDRLGRAEAFAELAPVEEVIDRRRDLEVARLLAEAERVDIELDRGRPVEAVALARRLVDHDPYRERHWAALVRGLAALGDDRAALQALDDASRSLAEVGLLAGAELASLEQRLLSGSRLGGTTSAGPRSRRGPVLDPFGLVERLWRAAPGEVLVLAGPAGSGKTTAVDAAARRAGDEGRPVLVAACRADAAVPLEPVVALVEQALLLDPARVQAVEGVTALGALSPALADGLGRPPGVVDRTEVHAVVGRVVDALEPGTILVVEDLHWAPPRTVEALHALAGGLGPGSPCTLWATTRADDEGALLPGAEPVAVPPWGVEQIAAWLAELAPDRARRDEVARWLWGQTGGRPLFVGELADQLAREGLLDPSPPDGRRPPPFRPPESVPPAVAAALATRVAQLSAPGRAVLDAAAVLGAELSRADLRAMVGDRAPGLAEVLDRGMLRASPHRRHAWTFEHELLRRVVLDEMGPARRAELHDVAVTAVGDRVAPGELARLALGARALDPARAVECTIAAGDDALARSARADAAEWWLLAAELLADDAGDGRRRLDLVVDAGQQLIHAGDPRARDVLFDAALDAERREDWHTAARAAVALARVGPTSAAGAPDASTAALCNRLMARIEDRGLRAALAAATTVVHSLSGRAELCRELYDQAEADACAVGRDEVWADVLPYAYQAIAAPGDLARREACADRLLAVARRLGRLDARWSALHLRFSNQVQRGDPDLRATAAELVELAPAIKEQSRDWELHYVGATVAHVDGHLDASEAMVTASLRFADTIAASRVMAVYGVQLLALRTAQGRVGELADDIAALAAAQPGVVAWHAAHALAASHAGRRAEAAAAFDRVVTEQGVALQDDQTLSAGLVALGEAVVELGDPRRAAALRPHLEVLADRWSWSGSCTLGPVASTLAGVRALDGDPTGARRAATAALASCEALGAPTFAAQARQRLG